MKHTITQEDIDNNEAFVTEDVKVGDEVEIEESTESGDDTEGDE